MTKKFVARENQVIALISSGHFFSHFFILVLPPLFPLMKQEFGVSYTMLGGISAIYAASSGLSQYPIGYLSDRLGARAFLIGGLTIISLAFIAMGFTNSISAFYALAIIAGLADGVFHPCDYTILTAAVDKARAGRAYAIHAFGGFSGFAIAPMVMVPLATIWGWQYAVITGGLAGLLAAIILLINFSKLATANTQKSDASKPQQKTSARAILTSLPLLFMFGFYVFSSMANMGITTHAVSALIEITGLSFASVSAILPAYLWGIAAGILAGGYVADYIRRLEVTACLGTFASSIILLMIALVHLPLALLIAAFFLTGFAYGSTLASRDVVVRAVSPHDAIGQAFGFVNTGYGVGSAIGPILVGWILDQGMLQTALLVPAFLFFMSMVFTATALKASTPHSAKELAAS